MRSFNLTIDNCLRHPLRWASCPFGEPLRWVFGMTFNSHDLYDSPGRVYVIEFYFYRRVWHFTRYV